MFTQYHQSRTYALTFVSASLTINPYSLLQRFPLFYSIRPMKVISAALSQSLKLRRQDYAETGIVCYIRYTVVKDDRPHYRK